MMMINIATFFTTFRYIIKEKFKNCHESKYITLFQYYIERQIEKAINFIAEIYNSFLNNVESIEIYSPFIMYLSNLLSIESESIHSNICYFINTFITYNEEFYFFFFDNVLNITKHY